MSIPELFGEVVFSTVDVISRCRATNSRFSETNLIQDKRQGGLITDQRSALWMTKVGEQYHDHHKY